MASLPLRLQVWATAYHHPLTDRGTLWESDLAGRGWNALSEEERKFELLDWCPYSRSYEAIFQGYKFIVYDDEIRLLNATQAEN